MFSHSTSQKWRRNSTRKNIALFPLNFPVLKEMFENGLEKILMLYKSCKIINKIMTVDWFPYAGDALLRHCNYHYTPYPSQTSELTSAFFEEKMMFKIAPSFYGSCRLYASTSFLFVNTTKKACKWVIVLHCPWPMGDKFWITNVHVNTSRRMNGFYY